MRNNVRSVILVIGGITFITAVEWMLNNLLYSVIYGISYMLILGSLVYQDETRINLKKKTILHFAGVVLLGINNVFVFSNLSAAILFSISILISLSGTYLLRFPTNTTEKDK